MKFRKTASSFALLGIFCAGLAAMPGRGWATECEAYTTAATAEDSYEPNNTPATATLLTSDVWKGAGGDPNCGVMFAAAVPDDEYDYYKIVVPAGNTGIQVDLRFKYSLGDMTLRLYGTDGTTVLATAATEYDNEFIDYTTALAAGTYYIRVYSSQAGNNRYRLMAHVVGLPATTYTVTPSSGGNGSFTPSSAQTVTAGNTLDLVLTPSNGYTASRTVGGTCPVGTWTDNTHYTTGAINATCNVVFSFGLTKTVTSSWTPAAGGSVTLGSIQNVTNGEVLNVASGDKPEFTVTPNIGYTTNSAVTGTCPAGSWAVDVYKINSAITGNCTVIFGFTANAVTHTVTPSAAPVAGGSFTPTGAQTVNDGTTKTFTVTANSGYTTNSAVTGTCPQGSWNSNVYTTGAITADCTVIFGFTATPPVTHTVTPSAAPVAGGSFTPTGVQTVNHNTTKAFTVIANSGYTTNSTVGGTCPQGGWSGNQYTTGAITTDCTVIFGFTLNTYTVSSNSATVTNGTVSPAAQNNVAHGSSTSFTMTPATGYTASASDNCGASGSIGSLVGTTYTINPVTKDCAVTAVFRSPSDTSNALPAIYKQLLLKAK